MIRRTHLFVMFLILTTAATSVCLGADKTADGWPGWRGANRDGKSSDTGLLKSWPEGGPKQLWSLSGIGSGYSSVSAGGGMIYTSGHKDGQLYLTAIDPGGKVKWSKGVTSATGKGPKGARATPTYDGGNLYMESGNGVVGCYDAKTGRQKWTNSFKDFGARTPGWAFSESVLIVGKLAIVSPGGRSFMVAFNKTTGAVVWRSGQYGSAHYSSPIYVVYRNVPMIINGGRNGLIGVNAKTGKILWTQDFATGNTANCPTPAFSNGYVFWSVGYGKGSICVKLSISGSRVSAKTAWKTRDMVCHHGGFVILDGFIYGNHSGGWTCLDLKTGEKQWYEGGVGKGSICYADGMLYVFGERGGKAGLAAVSSKGFKLVGKVSVSGRGPSWAHPVVTGGRLYLRYDDNLYCFDVKDPTKVVAKPPAAVKTLVAKNPIVRPKPNPITTTLNTKAARQLRLAEAYLKIGLKAKAASILKKVVADFPNTKAAKTATEKLQGLSGGNKR